MIATKALEVLAKCESDLRALVASAADSGDYDSVMRITLWAKQVAAMSSSEPRLSRTTNDNKMVAKSKRSSIAGTAYPRFLRRRDQLVKIGWSKRKKAEYEHKAPHQVALALAQLVGEAGNDGRIFQVATLLPLKNPADGTEIPGYQIYLVIAWWRSVGLLDQHGRQGYSLPKAARLLQSVESAWAALPEE
jgi:hypothetical protein